MTIAVCCLFLAPIGIASGGGHGSSVATFGMSGVGGAPGEGDLAGCLSAGFFSGFIAGGLARV